MLTALCGNQRLILPQWTIRRKACDRGGGPDSKWLTLLTQALLLNQRRAARSVAQAIIISSQRLAAHSLRSGMGDF